jgi:hypothetical protein
MKIVLQQVSKASLLVDNVDKWVSIEAGIIIYICFTKTKEPLTETKLEQTINDILSLGIIFSENWKENRSVVEEFSDILIIPQASLSGKLKGMVFIYDILYLLHFSCYFWYLFYLCCILFYYLDFIAFRSYFIPN